MKVYFILIRTNTKICTGPCWVSYDSGYIDAYSQRYVLISVSVDKRDLKGGDDLLIAKSVSIWMYSHEFSIYTQLLDRKTLA